MRERYGYQCRKQAIKYTKYYIVTVVNRMYNNRKQTVEMCMKSMCRNMCGIDNAIKLSS